MRFSLVTVALTASTLVSGHGVVTYIEGSNGVTMPGLTVIEGTPRDCPSNGCGSQADTAIIRQRELGTNRASALGRTQGGGPVDAAAAVANFMGTGNGRAAKRATIQKAKRLPGAKPAKRSSWLVVRQLRGLFGGNRNGGGGGNTDTKSSTTDTKPAALMPGAGASSGLPTCSDDGVVTMTYHQINQDGAGPLTAMVDPTSGGTDPSAFVAAKMINDVPGIAAGFSATTVQDFDISAQMPQGMVCSGEVAGETGVCIMRINNVTPAGPFGGSVAFVQSPGSKKRALEYLRLKKRHFARGVVERDTAAEEDCDSD